MKNVTESTSMQHTGVLKTPNDLYRISTVLSELGFIMIIPTPNQIKTSREQSIVIHGL